ncbi:MAG: hypothetical protein ACYDAI_13640 [Trichloromonadaceae bacterium]
MPNLEMLIRTVRMAIFATLVAWVIAAGAMDPIAPELGANDAAYPLAPINE